MGNVANMVKTTATVARVALAAAQAVVVAAMPITVMIAGRMAAMQHTAVQAVAHDIMMQVSLPKAVFMVATAETLSKKHKLVSKRRVAAEPEAAADIKLKAAMGRRHTARIACLTVQ